MAWNSANDDDVLGPMSAGAAGPRVPGESSIPHHWTIETDTLGRNTTADEVLVRWILTAEETVRSESDEACSSVVALSTDPENKVPAATVTRNTMDSEASRNINDSGEDSDLESCSSTNNQGYEGDEDVQRLSVHTRQEEMQVVPLKFC